MIVPARGIVRTQSVPAPLSQQQSEDYSDKMKPWATISSSSKHYNRCQPNDIRLQEGFNLKFVWSIESSFRLLEGVVVLSIVASKILGLKMFGFEDRIQYGHLANAGQILTWRASCLTFFTLKKDIRTFRPHQPFKSFPRKLLKKIKIWLDRSKWINLKVY